MRRDGLQGAQRQAKRRWLIRADEAAPRPADLVERRFVAAAPNQLWVCDLTYLKTREGFVFLAFVKDVFSRRIVGWQTAEHLRTDLVLDAVEMAVHLRGPAAGELIAHTDPRLALHQLPLHPAARRSRDHRERRCPGTLHTGTPRYGT